jgi:hypothetical protein
VLTLTGSATVANYQAALRSVTYANAQHQPIDRARTVSVVANDGTANSNTATRTITVAAVERRAGGDDDGGGAGVHRRQQRDGGRCRLDRHRRRQHATWRVRRSRHGELRHGEDVLGFTTQNGITGSFNRDTGVLHADGHADGGELPGRRSVR